MSNDYGIIFMYHFEILRVWFNGRISASQADGRGSIPLTRSIGQNGEVPKWL
jgi:hypothetical protein